MARKKKSEIQSTSGEDYFIQRLEAFEQEGHSEDWLKLQQEIFGEALQQNQVTAEDIQYGENLCDIVKEEREKSPDGRVYGRNEFVERMKLPQTPSLVFIKGGKNIGKTYGIAKYTEKLLAEDPKAQVLLVRTTMNEFQVGLNVQLMGEEGPYYLVQSSRKLMRKAGRLPERGEYIKPSRKRRTKKKEEDEAPKTGDDGGPDVCGFATYATGAGFTAFQGASYKNLKCVIWDELNDTGSLTPALFQKFLVFLLSLERNNRHLKVGLFGNLLRRQDGTAGDLALDFFKIPYTCRLKYFQTKNGTVCLYINTGPAGDLFDGVNMQTYTDIFGLEKAQDLKTNMPITPSKVLSFNSFLQATPYISFVVQHVESFGVVYVGKISIDTLNKTYFVLHIEQLSPHYYHKGYFPVSDNINVVNLFNGVRGKPKMYLAGIVRRLQSIEKNRQLFFSSDDVRMQGTSMLCNKLALLYAKELNKYIN